MTNTTDSAGSGQPRQEAIVEVSDSTGRVVDRRSFESDAEAQQYATSEEAKGLKARVSSLDPKPREEL